MSYFEFPNTRNYDSDLGWLIKNVKKLIDCCDAMEAWKDSHETQYQQLKKLYDDIMSGDLPDEVQKGFEKWMRENSSDIIGDLVNLVIFNITDDGYFVAYIPEGWDQILFGTTGLDTFIPELQPEYGHLVLSYEASTNAY